MRSRNQTSCISGLAAARWRTASPFSPSGIGAGELVSQPVEDVLDRLVEAIRFSPEGLVIGPTFIYIVVISV